MLSVNGKVRDLNSHLGRISDTCRFLKIEFDSSLSRWNKICSELLTANALNQARARMRLTVLIDSTGGDGVSEVLWADRVEQPESWALATLEPGSFGLDDNHEYKLHGAEWREQTQNEIKRTGVDDVVLVNQQGEAAECSRASIFYVIEGVVHTPSERMGILRSLSRPHIIRIAQSKGIKVLQKSCDVNMLREANEIFCTNCIVGVVGVRQIDDVSKEVGPVTAYLWTLYEKMWNG